MAKPIPFDESGDSEDLQALFDSIAAGAAPVVAAVEPDPSGDSDDLQALFDSVSAQVAETSVVDEGSGAAGPAALTSDGEQAAAMHNRLGHLARKLHDSLRELGYDKNLEAAARQIPDARERLSYIARMTEQAAARVLNAVDIAKPLQDGVEQNTKALGARWDRMFANQLSVEEFKQLAVDTRGFFAVTPAQLAGVNTQLTEIMMAQDFQDLTGQVIKKIVEVVQGVESQLLQMLIESLPADRRVAAPEGLMSGPVIQTAGRADIVTSQAQVDDLLESLGF